MLLKFKASNHFNVYYNKCHSKTFVYCYFKISIKINHQIHMKSTSFLSESKWIVRMEFASTQELIFRIISHELPVVLNIYDVIFVRGLIISMMTILLSIIISLKIIWLTCLYGSNNKYYLLYSYESEKYNFFLKYPLHINTTHINWIHFLFSDISNKFVDC